RQAAREGVECADEARVGVALHLLPAVVPFDAQVAVVEVLVAEAADLDRQRAGELARQVLDVDPGAAVDVRRVLVGEERDLAQGRSHQSSVLSRQSSVLSSQSSWDEGMGRSYSPSPDD